MLVKVVEAKEEEDTLFIVLIFEPCLFFKLNVNGYHQHTKTESVAEQVGGGAGERWRDMHRS